MSAFVVSYIVSDTATCANNNIVLTFWLIRSMLVIKENRILLEI